MNKKYIIIGASAAAVGAINGIRRIDQDAEIICISAEKEMPYNKCFLADYLAGKKELAQLAIFDQAQQAAKRVHLVLGTRIVKIDRESKTIYASDGRAFAYDTLLIATGSSPTLPSYGGTDSAQIPEISPTFPGGNFDGTSTQNTQALGIFTFQTAADAQNIISYCAENSVKRAIVVGTGLTGLECADALAQRGVAVTIIQRGSQLMSSQLDSETAALLADYARKAGITFYANDQVASITESESKVTGVTLASGLQLSTELLVFATGFKPNSLLAGQAGLTLEQNAIVTNDYMQTSDPHIYAAGDVALVKDQITGQKMVSCLWPDAMLQGLIAGQNMAGQNKTYAGMVPIMSSAFFSVKIAFYRSPVGDCKDNLIAHSSDVDFYKIYTHSQRVHSFYLLGTISLLGSLKRALLTHSPLILD